MGMVPKEIFGTKMCFILQQSLRESFNRHDWEEGAGMVLALEETCQCQLYLAYDMGMVMLGSIQNISFNLLSDGEWTGVGRYSQLFK